VDTFITTARRDNTRTSLRNKFPPPLTYHEKIPYHRRARYQYGRRLWTYPRNDPVFRFFFPPVVNIRHRAADSTLRNRRRLENRNSYSPGLLSAGHFHGTTPLSERYYRYFGTRRRQLSGNKPKLAPHVLARLRCPPYGIKPYNSNPVAYGPFDVASPTYGSGTTYDV